MSEKTKSVLEKICAALKQRPNYRESADSIQHSQRGLLLFFLPEFTEAEQPSGWQSIIADLTSVHPTLKQAGFSILAITPDITEESFEKDFDIPFPLVHSSPDDHLANTLWQVIEPEEPQIFGYALFVDQENDEAVKTWEKPGSSKLVSDVLLYLVKKKLLIFTDDTQIIQEVENEHLLKRRKKAAEQGGAILENQSPGSKSPQSEAFEKLMVSDRKNSPIGLAFSGGGIRSATFNLGITQGLARLRLLPWVDYLSSVSGGGFTAGALISLLSRRPRKGNHFFSTQWEQFPFNPEIEAFKSDIDLDSDPDKRENRNFKDVSHKKGHNNQLRYLIKNGNYLVPRLGLATRDLMGGVGTLLTGTGFTILLFVLAMFGLACLHYFSASMITPAVLSDIDTTMLSQETPPSDSALSVMVEVDGESKNLVFPLSGESVEDSGGSVTTESGDFSLKYLLFGSYAKSPPTLETAEVPLETGNFPWYVYLSVFVIGIGASYLSYNFLVATYSYPTREKKEEVQAQEPKDPFFPRPKYLLIFLWPALFLSIGVLGWKLFSSAGFPILGDLVYPLAFLIAGLLLALLLKGVPEKGTINPARWKVWLYLILLLILGVALVVPALQSLALPSLDQAAAEICLFFVIGLFAFMIYTISQRDVEADRWGKHGFDRWEWYDPFALRMILGLLVGIMLLSITILKEIFGNNFGTPVFWIWQPAVFFAGSFIFLIVVRLLIQGKKTTWASNRFRTMIWAIVGMNLYGLIAALFFAILAIPQILAVRGGEPTSAAIPLGAAILSGLWAAFLTQFTYKDTSGESILKKILALPSGIRNAVLGLLVIVLWFSLIFMFETMLDRMVNVPIQAMGYGLIALAILIALGSLQNFNYLSPHYFFGDRAADVFLKTEVELRDGRVATVRDESEYDLKRISPVTSSTPYHLVVTAVNMAGSGHQQDRDRKSRHFIFSKEFVGSDATGYVNTDLYRGGKINYSSTLALSGAAASPGLGAFTFFAQAFMLTLLNVRLGLWWLNPKEYKGVKSQDELDVIGDYENRAFWPLYLMDEALAKTSERRRLVNITDGGHTRDNGGLYPLFERRCKVIIAGDASQDSAGLCHDLFSVLYYVRGDLGIKVDIDVSGLQSAAESKDGIEEGMTEAHCAIGSIHYPAVYRPDGSEKYPAEKGWLVYFKPAVSKAMPSEVLQVWQTDKNMFPHPSTADQFFTERQFEAQRRLGEESVVLSLRALANAYEVSNPKLEDPGKEKSTLLKNLLENKSVDYALLIGKPELFDQIMQDWMDTISPLGSEDA